MASILCPVVSRITHPCLRRCTRIEPIRFANEIRLATTRSVIERKSPFILDSEKSDFGITITILLELSERIIIVKEDFFAFSTRDDKCEDIVHLTKSRIKSARNGSITAGNKAIISVIRTQVCKCQYILAKSITATWASSIRIGLKDRLSVVLLIGKCHERSRAGDINNLGSKRGQKETKRLVRITETEGNEISVGMAVRESLSGRNMATMTYWEEMKTVRLARFVSLKRITVTREFRISVSEVIDIIDGISRENTVENEGKHRELKCKINTYPQLRKSLKEISPSAGSDESAFHEDVEGLIEALASVISTSKLPLANMPNANNIETKNLSSVNSEYQSVQTIS